MLQAAAAAADGVLHTAFRHDGSVSMEEAASIDIAVIRAFTAGLTGTGKLLIISSSTGLVGDTRDALPTEDMPVDTTVLAATERSKCEREALLAAGKGIRPVVIRLSPYVYGNGGSVFIPLQLQAAKQLGAAYWVGNGNNKISAVHVEDAAEAYVLAFENPHASGVFHIANESGITSESIAQALAANVGGGPAKGLSWEEADKVGSLPAWIRGILSINN
eukprot:jgi/Chrzof1/7759/Cz02g35210.t1